jgi:hypothetical protein
MLQGKLPAASQRRQDERGNTAPDKPVRLLLAALVLVATGRQPVLAAEQPQEEAANIKIAISAARVDYFTDADIITARGGVEVVLPDGVTVTGDACSFNIALRRFVVAGHVRLATPAGAYQGAAFADFIPFRRAYFVPLESEPDRWTFLNDDWAAPEKGRIMPGDAFFLAAMGAAKPFITAKRVVIEPTTYATTLTAAFRLFNGAITTIPLPVYVRNFSQNPNFGVNSLSGASLDIPYGFAGSATSMDALHLRYDTQHKTYASFEHHSVFGDFGYAVFSLNPATQLSKQWNLLGYAATSARSALTLNAQLFTFQSGLSQPLSANGFADVAFTRALRQSAPELELTQSYDSFLAPPPLGYYGNPNHPFVPNHPLTAALVWPGFTQQIGRSGFSLRLLSGASTTHDVFGVNGARLHDVQTLYLGAILATPVVPAPLGTSLVGSYAVQHVWLSYPNTVDVQTATVSDSKRFSNKVFVTGTWLLQSAATKNLFASLISPNTSTGLTPQPASPNGFPLIAGVVMAYPHVVNNEYVLTASLAPSPAFQFTLTALENHYAPVQQPFGGGPPRYEAVGDVRFRISRTLFADVARAYYFNWGNQRWSPQFTVQISAQ